MANRISTGRTFEQTYPEYRDKIWRQWDKQEERRLIEIHQTQMYIEANNIYLQIERGEIENTAHTRNDVWLRIRQAYDRGDPMIDWWISEIDHLENIEIENETLAFYN